MKGLFDRDALRRMIRQTPRIREKYVVEILLPVSGKMIYDHCGSDFERAVASYNDWTAPRDRDTPAPIVWFDIQTAR